MNKKSLVKILQNDILAVQSLIQGFDTNGNISTFELDLTLSKTREILNELNILKSLADAIPFAKEDDLQQNIYDSKSEQTEQVSSISATNEVSENLAAFKLIKEPVPESGINEIDTPVLPSKPEPLTPTEPEVVVAHSEPETKPEPIEEIQENKPIPQKADPIIEVEPPKIEPKQIIETTIESVHKPTETPINKKTEATRPTEKGEIMADRFQNNGQSVNDMLSNFKKDKDLATLLLNRPVTDLKKAIKINDRIWYINELFHKNADLFNETVDKVNRLENLDEALAYLFATFNWDQSQKSTISFLELIFRRFTR